MDAPYARAYKRALARVTDPRQRRQRAYALLARNGFDPETCREASAELMAASTSAAANIDELEDDLGDGG